MRSVAHYAAFIWAKSPTKWNAQLPESNFQTHSRKNILENLHRNFMYEILGHRFLLIIGLHT
ncbi:DUF6783 domain-containing protein [Lachnospiraceae bacterium 45-P1]